MYVAQCCNFHGCGRNPANKTLKAWCAENADTALAILSKNQLPWKPSIVINHYCRSLEKFGLKIKTWKTANGDGADGSYDLTHFMDRNIGWEMDRTALQHSCQLREHLVNKTGVCVKYLSLVQYEKIHPLLITNQMRMCYC
jgi:hypothetical protein